jgi:hypothetical protein
MARARPLSWFLHVVFILVLANLAACGGGGGGSGGTGPTGPSDGTNNGNGANSSDVVTTTAYQFSADGHIQTAAAGISANLIEVDANGSAVRVIATKQTATDGTFAFDLKAAGATRSPRLWVQIASGAETYRAPLLDGGEVGPHTEAASRYVIERIQARGLPLADAQSAFGSALWSAARIALDGSGTAPDMATYVSQARQALDDEQQLQGWLSAYNASGTLSVLDVGNFFGFAVGNNWTYHHTTGSQIQSVGPTKRRQDSASGDIYVESATSGASLAFNTKDSEAAIWATDYEIYTINAKGFTQTDTWTQTQTEADRVFAGLLFPLPEIPLPLRPTARTILSEKTATATQLDVDGDNKQDALTVRNELLVQPGGRIAVAAGEFDTVLVERIGTYTWKPSGGKTLIETHTLKEWRAPNLGVIRRVDEWTYTSTIADTSPSGSSSDIYELKQGRVGQVYYPGRVHPSSYTVPPGIGISGVSSANGLLVAVSTYMVSTYDARTGQPSRSFALPANAGSFTAQVALSADASKVYFGSNRPAHLTQDIAQISAYNAHLHRFDVASGAEDFDLALPDMPSSPDDPPYVWARYGISSILVNPSDPTDAVIEAFGLLRLKGTNFLPQTVPSDPARPYNPTDQYTPTAWVEGRDAILVSNMNTNYVVPGTQNGLSLDGLTTPEGIILRSADNRTLSQYVGGSYSIVAPEQWRVVPAAGEAARVL